MILQITYDKGVSSRQDEQYIGEVEEVRFYETGVTFKKNNSESDKGFTRNIEYLAENDIESVYLLNNEGKTLKIVRDVQGKIKKAREKMPQSK